MNEWEGRKRKREKRKGEVEGRRKKGEKKT